MYLDSLVCPDGLVSTILEKRFVLITDYSRVVKTKCYYSPLSVSVLVMAVWHKAKNLVTSAIETVNLAQVGFKRQNVNFFFQPMAKLIE